jgi:hypothetical protein
MIVSDGTIDGLMDFNGSNNVARKPNEVEASGIEQQLILPSLLWNVMSMMDLMRNLMMGWVLMD